MYTMYGSQEQSQSLDKYTMDQSCHNRILGTWAGCCHNKTKNHLLRDRGPETLQLSESMTWSDPNCLTKSVYFVLEKRFLSDEVYEYN